MNLSLLAAKNVGRNKFRVTLTIAGIAVAILAFVTLRTVIWAWTVNIQAAAKDRLGTRHKVTFILPLPKKYVEMLRPPNGKVKGIKQVTWANWFGGKDPNHKKLFFATMAVDHTTFLDVYDEVQITPEEKANWFADRQGAIVGDALAKQLGVKVGDKITLVSEIYDGEWDFHVVAIYTATRKSVDRSTFAFRWDYFNESKNLDERQKNKVGWIVSRIDDPSRSAEISRQIDELFEREGDEPTLTMTEKAMQLSFLGMFSTILLAINVVSVVILVIMMLILGNTVAMGVRERTNEYGVLRAVGFLPRHLFRLVVGEAMVIGTLGAIIGLAFSYMFVNVGVGRYIEENMGGIFPYFRVTPTTAAWGGGLALVIALVASLLPAYQASRVPVTEALRRVG